MAKGGEIRDTKTLNLSRNIVPLQVTLVVWSTSHAAKTLFADWKKQSADLLLANSAFVGRF